MRPDDKPGGSTRPWASPDPAEHYRALMAAERAREAAREAALADDTHPVHALTAAVRAAAAENRVPDEAEMYEAAYEAGWVVVE